MPSPLDIILALNQGKPPGPFPAMGYPQLPINPNPTAGMRPSTNVETGNPPWLNVGGTGAAPAQMNAGAPPNVWGGNLGESPATSVAGPWGTGAPPAANSPLAAQAGAGDIAAAGQRDLAAHILNPQNEPVYGDTKQSILHALGGGQMQFAPGVQNPFNMNAVPRGPLEVPHYAPTAGIGIRG